MSVAASTSSSRKGLDRSSLCIVSQSDPSRELVERLGALERVAACQDSLAGDERAPIHIVGPIGLCREEVIVGRVNGRDRGRGFVGQAADQPRVFEPTVDAEADVGRELVVQNLLSVCDLAVSVERTKEEGRDGQPSQEGAGKKFWTNS